jgi:hypothetical protein
VKAAIDRPIEDVIKALCLLERQPFDWSVLGDRIPGTFETQALTRYDGSPPAWHASYGREKRLVPIGPTAAQVVGEYGTINRS